MPEGDSVLRAARRLHAAFAGKPLVVAELRWPTLGGVRDLPGVSTIEVVARGKHLLHRFADGRTLHTHLRMDGRWHLDRTGEAPAGRLARNPRTRVLLATEEWTAAGLQLGMVQLLWTVDEHRVVGHLGPDVLGADWDPERAAKGLAAADHVGAALLDQRVLAGVGTVWASESLFLQRLDPWSRVDAEAGQGLADRLHRLMSTAMTSQHRAPTGERGRDREFFVYGRVGRPCRRCGTAIRTGTVGPPTQERSLAFCPSCQAVGVGEDGDRRVRKGTSTQR